MSVISNVIRLLKVKLCFNGLGQPSNTERDGTVTRQGKLALQFIQAMQNQLKCHESRGK